MIEVQEIENIREDLVRIGSTEDPQDTVNILVNLTAPTRTLIEQIKDLDHSKWDELKSRIDLVDDTLSSIVTLVRKALERVEVHRDLIEPFRFSNRVVQVQGGSFLHIDSGTPILRIVFKTADGKIIVTDQDFEDTVAIGRGILELVAEVGKRISDKFGASLRNVVLGNELRTHLEMIENVLKDIRQLHGLKGGMEDGAGSEEA